MFLKFGTLKIFKKTTKVKCRHKSHLSCTLLLFFAPLILRFFFAVNFPCRFNIASCFEGSLFLYRKR